jgi:protein phosphatase 1 regulatory subunit 12A
MWAAGHTNDTPESDGLKMVELLVGRGADIEAEDDRGWTPVMTAAARGHAAIVRFLKQRGADIGHKARDGRGAIELAADETVKKALGE